MKKNTLFWVKAAIYTVLAIAIVIGVVHYSSMDFSMIVNPDDSEESEELDVLYYEELSDTDLSYTDLGVVDEGLYESIEEDTCIVKVVECSSYTDSEEMGVKTRKQVLYVEVLSGPRKGEFHYAEFDRSNPSGGEPYELSKEGDRLLCFFTVNKDGVILDNGTITDYHRMPSIIWAFVLFMLLLLFLTGKSGVKSFIALFVTCAGIILIILPMILSGISPVVAAIIGCVFVILTTLVLVYGFTVKTLAAALGALGGVIVAGVFTAIMNGILHMTGATCGDANMLALHFANGEIDLNGITFAAVLIGSLGGTIDVGVSIASALDEMREHAPDITAFEMIGSGLKIGSDIMSASLNTLILAYVGSSIHLLLMLRINGIALVDVLNQETITSELLRALAGSFGLLFTVPITSFVAGAMLCKGGFGKFSIRVFPAVDSFLNFCSRVKGKWDTAMKEAKERSDVKYGIQGDDNIYDRVRMHADDLDDFDDEFPEDIENDAQ